MLYFLGVLGTTIALGLACGLALPGCENPHDNYTVVRICADGTRIVRWRNGVLTTGSYDRVESVDVCSPMGVRQ